MAAHQDYYQSFLGVFFGSYNGNSEAKTNSPTLLLVMVWSHGFCWQWEPFILSMALLCLWWLLLLSQCVGEEGTLPWDTWSGWSLTLWWNLNAGSIRNRIKWPQYVSQTTCHSVWAWPVVYQQPGLSGKAPRRDKFLSDSSSSKLGAQSHRWLPLAKEIWKNKCETALLLG